MFPDMVLNNASEASGGTCQADVTRSSNARARGRLGSGRLEGWNNGHAVFRKALVGSDKGQVLDQGLGR